MCLVFFRIMSVFVIVVFVLGLVVVVLFRVRFYWLLMRLMYSILADESGAEEAAARKRRRDECEGWKRWDKCGSIASMVVSSPR